MAPDQTEEFQKQTRELLRAQQDAYVAAVKSWREAMAAALAAGAQPPPWPKSPGMEMLPTPGEMAEASYAFNDDFALGVQGFGDAGANGDFGLDGQAQYWGPFAQIEAGRFNDGELELQFGYLAGFGPAEADGVFRVKLEYEFGGHDTDD